MKSIAKQISETNASQGTLIGMIYDEAVGFDGARHVFEDGSWAIILMNAIIWSK